MLYSKKRQSPRLIAIVTLSQCNKVSESKYLFNSSGGKSGSLGKLAEDTLYNGI